MLGPSRQGTSSVSLHISAVRIVDEKHHFVVLAKTILFNT